MTIDSPDPRKRKKLLYIAGFPRSGSTILSNVLNETEGLFNAGELLYIWDRMISPEGFCGCGELVPECSVWGEILEVAFANMEAGEFSDIIALRNRNWRTAKLLHWLTSKRAEQEMLEEMAEYFGHLEKFYDAIFDRIPENVIIDSSKNAAYLYWLSLLPNLDVYVVHVVRDPRANVYSLLKPKKGVQAIRKSALGGALSWDQRNLALSTLGKRFGDKYLLLRYEDFIADPELQVQNILELMDEDTCAAGFLSEGALQFGQNHCVYGNTDLFKRGLVTLQLDERWKEMRKKDWLITSLLTWPVMKRFRYSLR